MRVCSEPDCHRLQIESRCFEHRRVREQARGTRQQRGYDADYDRQRLDLWVRLLAGEVFHCWRCGRVVMPHDFSLGHCDDDRSVIHGPEHLVACNLANTRGGCPHASHTGP